MFAFVASRTAIALLPWLEVVAITALSTCCSKAWYVRCRWARWVGVLQSPYHWHSPFSHHDRKPVANNCVHVCATLCDKCVVVRVALFVCVFECCQGLEVLSCAIVNLTRSNPALFTQCQCSRVLPSNACGAILLCERCLRDTDVPCYSRRDSCIRVPSCDMIHTQLWSTSARCVWVSACIRLALAEPHSPSASVALPV